MEQEIWKDITGYEGLYQVSNLGRVKSFPKYKRKKIIILKPRYKRDYLEVVLYKYSLSKPIIVHRLVAQEFILNPENKPEVNHKNGIKSDNRVENLEWMTTSENVLHAFKTGLNKFVGEKHHLSHLKEKDIIFIRQSKLRYRELAKIFNTCVSVIGKIKNYQSWKYFN